MSKGTNKKTSSAVLNAFIGVFAAIIAVFITSILIAPPVELSRIISFPSITLWGGLGILTVGLVGAWAVPFGIKTFSGEFNQLSQVISQATLGYFGIVLLWLMYLVFKFVLHLPV